MLNSIARDLKRMLGRDQSAKSGFAVTLTIFNENVSAKILKELARQGYPLGLFLYKKDTTLHWRLYDIHAGTNIVAKGCSIGSLPPVIYAERIADEVWPLLTGQEGFFSTRIAFCKEIRVGKSKMQKHIYITTPYAHPEDAASFESVVVNQGLTFAPRWNKDIHNPLLLYCQSTSSNVRLMSTTLDRKRRIIANSDGVTMLPSFSPDGKKIAYCSSLQGGTQLYVCEFNPREQRTLVRKLTDNLGNNTSPTIFDNGDIIFCSDVQAKGPQICYYHADSCQIEHLTTQGYCTSPDYCPKNRKIAYVGLKDGCMQVFIYDLISHVEYQLTFDKTDKDECSWSPCGNYIVFAQDDGKHSRIVQLNILTNEKNYLTALGDRCTYCSWSPRYEVPLITSTISL
jgi:TolB protein